MSVDLLTQPSYWLVHGLPWHGPADLVQEAAYAIAPCVTPRAEIPRDAQEILAVTDFFYEKCPARVVFFSDVTRWLDSLGQSWDSLAVDWEAGFAFLDQVPGLFLTVSHRALAIICDASREGVTLVYLDGGTEQITAAERDRVHDALEQKLSEDWPAYAEQFRPTST